MLWEGVPPLHAGLGQGKGGEMLVFGALRRLQHLLLLFLYDILLFRQPKPKTLTGYRHRASCLYAVAMWTVECAAAPSGGDRDALLSQAMRILKYDACLTLEEEGNNTGYDLPPLPWVPEGFGPALEILEQEREPELSMAATGLRCYLRGARDPLSPELHGWDEEGELGKGGEQQSRSNSIG